MFRYFLHFFVSSQVLLETLRGHTALTQVGSWRWRDLWFSCDFCSCDQQKQGVTALEEGTLSKFLICGCLWMSMLSFQVTWVVIPCSLLYLLDLIFNTSICGHKKPSKGFQRITVWSKLVVQIQKLLVYRGSLLQHFSGVAGHVIWPQPILQSLFCLRKCQGDWLPIRHQGQTYELMAGSQGKKKTSGANWGKRFYQWKRESQRKLPDLAMLIASIYIYIAYIALLCSFLLLAVLRLLWER